MVEEEGDGDDDTNSNEICTTTAIMDLLRSINTTTSTTSSGTTSSSSLSSSLVLLRLMGWNGKNHRKQMSMMNTNKGNKFNIRIGIIDTGIDDRHPLFNNNNNDPERKVIHRSKWYRHGTPLKDDYHGTHVAGTIHKLVPYSTIYDYRVYRRSGDKTIEDSIVTALSKACYEDRCQIIHLSAFYSTTFPKRIEDTIQNIQREKGVIVVTAGTALKGDNNDENSTITTSKMARVPVVALDDTMTTTSLRSIRIVRDDEEIMKNNNKNDTDSRYYYAGFGGGSVWSLKPGGGYKCLSGPTMVSSHTTGFIATTLALSTSVTNATLDSYTITIQLLHNEKKEENYYNFFTFLTPEEFQHEYQALGGIIVDDDENKEVKKNSKATTIPTKTNNNDIARSKYSVSHKLYLPSSSKDNTNISDEQEMWA